jgi:hypothetical protein
VSTGAETESPVNKDESIEVRIESLITLVPLPKINVESGAFVTPESEGKISNPSSGPVSELYKIISSGSLMDVICCSVNLELLLLCFANSLLTYSSETVLKQASNQIL